MARPSGTSKSGLKYLTQEQIRAFLKALENGKSLRDEVAMRLTFRLGLRVQELANLRISDINFDSHQIHVKGVKNGRERWYDIEDTLWKKLIRYLRESKAKDQLFPLTPQGWKFVFKRYAQETGLPSDFSIHSMRHSVAMAMAREGASPIFIQNWLRHRSITSSEIYFQELEDKRLDQSMNEKVFPDFM
jgi:integrase